MPGNIDADLLHDGDGFGPHLAGFVPALSTLKWSLASCRSSPSAIWLRAEFPADRMSTLFLSAMCNFLRLWRRHEHVLSLNGKRGDEPAEYPRRCQGAGELDQDEARRIRRADSRECVRRRAG